jgi:hypothetical protein
LRQAASNRQSGLGRFVDAAVARIALDAPR